MAKYLEVGQSRDSWRLFEVTYENGKRKRKSVSQLSYQSLGFTTGMTIEEARMRAKQLNIIGAKETATKIAVARRIEEDKLLDTAYLPKALVEEFVTKLEADNFGGAKNLQKQKSAFKLVKRMVVDQKLEPHQYGDSSRKIYKYLKDKQLSPDYVKTILGVLNRYGAFVCRKQERFYAEVERPRGQVREQIAEAYEESENFRGESDPITPTLLDKKLSNFSVVGQADWVHLTVWLGIRPEEADSLHDKKNYRIEHRKDIEVLWVYQSKLTSVEKSKRWKPIPLIYPEQKQCLAIIAKGEFNQPLAKTLKKIFGERTTGYGGRKGFTDLMLDKGQKLEDISIWLGHTSIERTWNNYKNKNKVSYTKAS